MAEEIQLANHLSIREAGYDEYWLQDQIYKNPACLGLGQGELDALAKERLQPGGGGRLDILLKDPEDDTMYEVEVMLGETDETHIIRTIEYWDNERRRWPQRQHIAVLIAEHINRRFFNVIHLLSHSIPIIAIQVALLQSHDKKTLFFTKVLDTYEEIDDGLSIQQEPATRESWEAKASKKTLTDTDELLTLVREIQPKASLNYKGHYIGLEINGVSKNFVAFRPRKANVIMDFKLPDQGEEMKVKIDVSGMRTLAYDRQFKYFKISIDRLDIAKQGNIIRELIRQAWELYGKP